MPASNARIAAVFETIADLLEIDDANPFRVRAYRNAARSVQAMGRELATLVERGEDLTRLPGIGTDLAAKIVEIVRTGKCRALQDLQRKLPAGLTDLLAVPGLGPKRVKALYRELGVHTVVQLERAARKGQVRVLEGFGEKTEQHILDHLGVQTSKARRFSIATAAPQAAALVAWLRPVAGVSRVALAGSFRRRKESVGDLDVLVCARDSAAVMHRFVDYGPVREVQAEGTTRASVILQDGLQVDLRVVPAESFGAALHYFTGSRAHNIAVRRIAQAAGLKLNEYGVFRSDERIAGEDEESVFRALGLPYIDPALREDSGEIEAARAGKLPDLVDLADLRGDLHVRTSAAQGSATVEEMARAARKCGFSYLAITDRAPASGGKHLPEWLAVQMRAVDDYNRRQRNVTVLKGVEVEILADGRLGLPDAVLADLDVVVAAVHSSFDLPQERQTARILRAMANPLVSMLAHPTARLIGRREPMNLDMTRIVREAAKGGCVLELNADPARLDLNEHNCRMAREAGALIAIDCGASTVSEFANRIYGVGQGRRGWLEKRHVINTRSLSQLRALLARRRSGAARGGGE